MILADAQPATGLIESAGRRWRPGHAARLGAFLKSLVLGWVILPVLAIKRLTRRKAKNNKEDSRSRHMLMILTAESLIETLDKGDSDPEQLQEIIDKLDELNDSFDA
jgi:F420-0:gamma-glutamyl ligase-like protein